MIGPLVDGISRENLNKVKVGSRVECKGDFGTVKFIGEIPGTKGTWLGIDWDDKTRGKHNGTYEGIFYFQARYPTSGSFVRLGKVYLGRSCFQAILERYGEIKNDETAGINRDSMADLQKRIKAPFFTVVGFDKINKKQSKFDQLEVVCLRNSMVNDAGNPGELMAMCPNIRELDFSKNLLCDWHDVSEITFQLKQLRVLNVSENVLELPQDPVLLKNAFLSLEHIILGRMGYSWQDILLCSKMWPNLRILQVPFNNISTLESFPVELLELLESLDLEGNPINDWNEINKLGKMKGLKSLNAAKTGLVKISLPVDRDVQKTDLFPELKVLILRENFIDCWDSVSELEKLQKLEELKFRDNPVLLHESTETNRELIIARISNLKVLDSMIISPEERRGAEYDYLKLHGPEWHALRDSPEGLLLFCQKHPCFKMLVEKYGLLKENEVQQEPSNLKSHLLELEMFNPDYPENKFRKKLPMVMTVQKLITLAQKLFKLNRQVPELNYINRKRPNVEIPLDKPMKDLAYYSIENGDLILVRW